MSSTVRSDRSNVSACPIRSRFTAINPTRFSWRVSSSVSNQCSVEVRAALRSHRVGDPTQEIPVSQAFAAALGRTLREYDAILGQTTSGKAITLLRCFDKSAGGGGGQP